MQNESVIQGSGSGTLNTLKVFIWRYKKNPQQCAGFRNMAESEGFEPPVGLTPRLISSQVH